MIRRPAVGQNVQLWYAKRYAARMPYHGRIATVERAARGPGPRSVLVRVDGAAVIVPFGNLRIPQ